MYTKTNIKILMNSLVSLNFEKGQGNYYTDFSKPLVNRPGWVEQRVKHEIKEKEEPNPDLDSITSLIWKISTREKWGTPFIKPEDWKRILWEKFYLNLVEEISKWKADWNLDISTYYLMAHLKDLDKESLSSLAQKIKQEESKINQRLLQNPVKNDYNWETIEKLPTEWKEYIKRVISSIDTNMNWKFDLAEMKILWDSYQKILFYITWEENLKTSYDLKDLLIKIDGLSETKTIHLSALLERKASIIVQIYLNRKKTENMSIAERRREALKRVLVLETWTEKENDTLESLANRYVTTKDEIISFNLSLGYPLDYILSYPWKKVEVGRTMERTIWRGHFRSTPRIVNIHYEFVPTKIYIPKSEEDLAKEQLAEKKQNLKKQGETKRKNNQSESEKKPKKEEKTKNIENQNNFHIVQKWDTLSKIANKNWLTLKKLLLLQGEEQASKLRKSNFLIRPWDKIKIK